MQNTNNNSFISKKYEWLIGINHHDALIATRSKVEVIVR